MYNIEDFEKAAEDGLVTRRESANKRFVIFNYTVKTQLERLWTPITLVSRGIIFDVQMGRLVACPMKKFFNYRETEENQPYPLFEKAHKGFEAAKKIDGSLGIVYWDYYDNQLKVATRGTFESEQAIWATRFLKEKLSKKIQWALEDLSTNRKTPLVEIVYPDNRIIVDYKGENNLYLLQIVDNNTGETSPYQKVAEYARYIGMSYAEVLNVHDLNELTFLQSQIKATKEEGYVVRFHDGHLVKFKGEDYLQVAKALAHFNNKTIFELARDGKDLLEYFAEYSLPDELYSQSQDTYDRYIEAVNAEYSRWEEIFKSVPNISDRREMAAHFRGNVPGGCSMMGTYYNWKNGDGGSALREHIWKNMDYRTVQE